MPQKTAQQYVDNAIAQIPKFAQVLAATKSSADIPNATKAAGLVPYLLNLGLSTTVHTLVGTGLHVPVQIDPNGGGRKSIYDLAVGEDIVVGIYIVNGTIYYRNVKRDSGVTPTGADGDVYTERVTKLDGTPAASVTGTLKILDPIRGVGVISPAQAGGVIHSEEVNIWVGWSFVKVSY